MSRKDFKLIAGILFTYQPQPIEGNDVDAELRLWTAIVERFAAELHQTNERFDRDRFVKACGLK
jgi:hypothetical protein